MYCREHSHGYYGIIDTTANGPEGFVPMENPDHIWPKPPMTVDTKESAASAMVYVCPPEYYHDLDNHSLPFEEVKHHHLEQAVQQLADRNGPKAKRIIDMISNHPPIMLPKMNCL